MPRNDGQHHASWRALGLLWVLLMLCGSLEGAPRSYDPGKRRDPFVPLSGENAMDVSDASGFKLEGIIYDPTARSMVMLNGKAYQVGEVVGSTKIVKISKDHVVILVNEEEKVLRLREEEKT